MKQSSGSRISSVSEIIERDQATAYYPEAFIAEPVHATLGRLIKVAKVAVITGRSRQDALAILGFEPHLLVGNHGSEWPAQAGRRNWQQIALCTVLP